MPLSNNTVFLWYGLSLLQETRESRRYVNYCMNRNGVSGKKCIFAA